MTTTTTRPTPTEATHVYFAGMWIPRWRPSGRGGGHVGLAVRAVGLAVVFALLGLLLHFTLTPALIMGPTYVMGLIGVVVGVAAKLLLMRVFARLSGGLRILIGWTAFFGTLFLWWGAFVRPNYGGYVYGAAAGTTFVGMAQIAYSYLLQNSTPATAPAAAGTP